ncbi:MAG: hypothetical protein ABJC89_21985 [Acidobacteriota bacterium]
MKIYSRFAILAASVFLFVAPRSDAQSVTSAPAELAWMSAASEPSTPSGPAGPPNLIAAPDIRQLAATMWQGSPTFRRQSARIAAAPGLQISIQQGMPKPGAPTRAETTCRREAGVLVSATVWIPYGYDAYELLAHELEHIIEQLDDLDLPALERQSGSGVWGSARGQFETVRATAIGRLVAKEMWNRPAVVAAR